MSAKKKQENTGKAAKVRELSASDIEVQIAKSSQELLDLRLKKTTGQVDNPLRIRILRREIARLKTIFAEKQKTAKA